jgi:hypothetical protein
MFCIHETKERKNKSGGGGDFLQGVLEIRQLTCGGGLSLHVSFNTTGCIRVRG